MRWFEIHDIEKMPTPALAFYRSRIEENIRKMIEIAGGPSRLVPHVKTHKCAEVVQMQQKHGISRFKCATIAEAEMLGMCQVKEVILAYQPVGPNILRFTELIRRYPDTHFCCLCDNSEIMNSLNSAAEGLNKPISVYIDLDCGMHRTGASPEMARKLGELSVSLDFLELKGLHAYDGHLHDPDLNVRKKKALATNALAKEVREAIDPGLEIIIGGSPTFPIHAGQPDVNLSPGTTVLWDKGYGNSKEGLEMFHPAALILSRVISNPADHVFCLDAGHKAISAEHQQPPEIMGVDSFEVVAHSEEHLAIRTNSSLSVGQELYLVPHHICPTVALHEQAIVVEDNRVTDRWKIYRQRKIHI